MRKYLIIFGILPLALIGLIFLGMVPIPDSIDECHRVEGIVDEIWEAGEKDIVFRLYDHEKVYYINRGLEQGLTLEDLRKKLLQRKVIIYHPKYWAPLDPNGYSKHLSKLMLKDEVIYNEIRE